MTLIDIVKAGNPILQAVTKPVTNFGSKALMETQPIKIRT